MEPVADECAPPEQDRARVARHGVTAVATWAALTVALALGCAAQETVPRTRTLPGVSASPFPYASPESVGLSSGALEDLALRVEGWVQDGRIVGAELLVVKSRQVVLHEAIGWSDKEAGVPLERNTLYRIRSMTKPFTGTSILIMVEEGRLGLDDPVSNYLPSWRGERSKGVTLRQLLTHTGGFIQGGFPEPFAEYGSLREAADAVGEMGPHHEVGERFVYSDLGSATLGAVIAEVSGMPVERYIESRILERLGLTDTHTGYEPGMPWASRMNPTYNRLQRNGSWIQYWHPSQEQAFPFFRASGGLYTTAFDYARWLTCFMDLGRLGDTRVLSEEKVREALMRGSEADYGLHWEIFGEPTEEGAIPPFGHGGSDGTLAMAFPEHDAMVLIFTQSRGNNAIREFGTAVREMLRRPLP
ncbi:serine hydrolase domain-containing protein [Gemmatimonadota bacterium]